MKQVLNLMFQTKNKNSAFYLLNKIDKIDEILKTTMFPSEIARSQRPLAFYTNFKANEYRNLLFYSFLFIFKDSMRESYFEHFAKYVLFIRKLTKEKINENDLSSSRLLINTFIDDFEELYGSENMSYNLHVHLHLVDQVENIGSLDKSSSCMAGESCFKMCKNEFHGTNFIASQIAFNINLKSQIKEYLILEEIQRVENLDMRAFYTQLRKSKHSKIESFLSPQLTFCETIKFSTLTDLEKSLFFNKYRVNIPLDLELIRGSQVDFKKAS